MAQHGPQRPRNALVLCFDGTGNKFSGTAADSNIIKIYGLLDRRSPHVHAYYQPGIGTYIEDSALTKTSRLAKIRSAYMKAKDQAVGTSFDSHVMAAYAFLMKHYALDDDLFIFGFSRGAYIARFLAEMIDSVGLLSHGNEEMMRFAWKAFANWQTRSGETEEQRKKKHEMFNYMKAFRETFSRPVRRIRFLGLFDTVNSVPRFETAWMSRAKYPYACKSSARVIRHAVSIDENRAKFRQNLISQKKPGAKGADSSPNASASAEKNGRPSGPQHHQSDMGRFAPRQKPAANGPAGGARRPPAFPQVPLADTKLSHQPSTSSLNSTTFAEAVQEQDEDDEEAEQDIQEIWFPGCHADIGGGWPIEHGLEAGLSHGPLLWMVREARKAGVPFSDEALEHSQYLLEDGIPDEEFKELTDPPEIQVDNEPLGPTPSDSVADEHRKKALEILDAAVTKGIVHDSLKMGRGTPAAGVMLWNMMEMLPFRRWDLKDDGSWETIRWPLPFGEPRDIPDDAWIHHTALRRMEANPDYRPGNLIVGGGGRGIKVAPKEAGTGKWRVEREKDSPVGKCVVRALRGGTWA